MAKKLNVDSLLKSKNTKSSKKESDVPEIPGLEVLADEVHELKVAAENAEAAFRVGEDGLLKQVRSVYQAHALDGSFSKSFNIAGEETNGVQVTFQDRFSEIDIANESALKKSLGQDFSKILEQKRVIQLKKTDDATISELVKKLGQETFERIFEVKLSLVTKSGVDEKQFSLPAAVQELIKQFKASVKLRK